MTEERFDLVFDGRLATGFSQEQVRLNMAELFSLGEAQLKTLFSGRPVVLKRNLDKGQAIRFRNRLAQAGALGLIRPHQATDAAAADAAAVPQAAPAAAARPPVARPAPKPVEAKPSEAKPTAAKPVASKPAVSAPAAEKPAAPIPAAAVKPVVSPSPSTSVSAPVAGEAVTCPRCGHEQPRSDSCGACRMDLRLHLQRLEKRARLVAARRS